MKTLALSVALACLAAFSRSASAQEPSVIAARGTPAFAAPVAMAWPGGVTPPPKPLMPLLTDGAGDGRLQLLVGDGEGKVWLVRLNSQDGAPAMAGAEPLRAAGQVIRVGGPCEPNLADMTGRGRKDVVLAWNRRLWIFPGAAAGAEFTFGAGAPLGGFADPFLLPDRVDGRATIADWNGDGLPDVIAADFDGKVHVLVNTGTRQRPAFEKEFLAEVAGRPIGHPHVPYVRFLDANSDGACDLALGLNWGYVSFYLNAAAEGAPRLLPEVRAVGADGATYNVRTLTSDCIHPAFGDVDGDGIADMIFGGHCSQLFFAKGLDIGGSAIQSLEKFLSKPPAALARKLATDPEALAELLQTNSALAATLRWTLPGTSARAEFFGRCAAHVKRFPAYYAAATLDPEQLPALAWFVAQARQNLAVASDWDPARLEEVARLLRMTGRRATLLNRHGVLLLDNGRLGEPELRYLNALFELIPQELHRLRIVSVADYLGKRPEGMESLPNVEGVNVFSRPWQENAFPADSAAASAPVFCACASHEVNHVVDAHTIQADPALMARLYSLIRQAAPSEVVFRVPPEGSGLDWDATKGNFRRQRLWDGNDATWKSAWEAYWRKLGTKAQATWLRNNTSLVLEAPQEAFATLANQYFTDGRTMFDLSRRRWRAGVRGPINQFLFFADVYSRGKNVSYLYRTDREGNLRREDMPLKRDAQGRIEALQLDGQWHRFTLDADGWVTKMD